MGYKVKLKREGQPDIILRIDDAGVVSLNAGQQVVMHDIDKLCAMLRTIVSSMKANGFTTIEVEEE